MVHRRPRLEFRVNRCLPGPNESAGLSLAKSEPIGVLVCRGGAPAWRTPTVLAEP